MAAVLARRPAAQVDVRHIRQQPGQLGEVSSNRADSTYSRRPCTARARHQLAFVHVFAPVLVGVVLSAVGIVGLIVAPVSVLDLPHRVKARIDLCL